MMLVLLKKIKGIYIFNATNLYQNAVKNYIKLPQIQCIILHRSRTLNEPIKVERKSWIGKGCVNTCNITVFLLGITGWLQITLVLWWNDHANNFKSW